MKVNLLYNDHEWNNEGSYIDSAAIVQDLGLETLFLAAAKELEVEDDKVVFIHEADLFLQETMKKVVCVPLQSKEEIRYRQGIMQDFFANPDFVCRLYDISDEMLAKWDKLGRRAGAKAGTRNSPRVLITEIHVLQLFVTTLKKIKELFSHYMGEGMAPTSGLIRKMPRSEGLRNFYKRLQEEFSYESEMNLEKLLADIAFFANENEHDESMMGLGQMVQKPKIVMKCNVGEGMKFEGFALEGLTTQVRRHRDAGSAINRAQNYISNLTTDSFSTRQDITIQTQVGEMEYRIVQYVVSYTENFKNAFGGFFDQFHFQIAFYRSALNLKQYMDRFYIDNCFPKVCGERDLRFADLKELVMGIEQRINPVGNSCEIMDKNLLIVTGANQGGKSTFLRSIGIAQVMMQCGLPVAAREFASGIFPSLFTHFTRREDSEMNSGRLDEELGRISRIIDNLGEHSMVLLNESFATTTEKEGSVIAYDIIKALTEAGVKILTVTHLLSFARRMYEEHAGNDKDATECISGTEEKGNQHTLGVEFFSAERMESGRRTFKMIQHAPELTSFGLDLYDEIIGQKN